MPNLITAPDGRTLELHEAGDPRGLPVIVHHGTPGSGVLYDRWATPGIRLIAYDRAGYGGSTRNRGRAIAAAVADVEAIADALELDRYATWGISGGGPHALACAALCGDRLIAAAITRRGGAVGRRRPRLARRHGRGQRRGILPRARRRGGAPAVGRARPHHDARAEREGNWTSCSRTLLGPADRAALTGRLAAWLHEDMQPRARSPPPTAGSTTTSRSPLPGASTSATSRARH